MLFCCREFEKGGGHRAFGFFQCLDHTCYKCLASIDPIFPRDDVFPLMGEKSNHLIVPRGFFIKLQNLGISSACIVMDEKGGKRVLNGLNDGWIGPHLTTKLFTPASSWDFLKEGEDGFARFFSISHRLIMVTQELGGACFHDVSSWFGGSSNNKSHRSRS